jgi:hypothetical protein
VQAVSIVTKQSRRSNRVQVKSASRLVLAEPSIPTKYSHRQNEQDPQLKVVKSIYIYPLVRVAYLERDDSDQDARDEEEKRDDEPNDTPNFFGEVVKRALWSAPARSNKEMVGLPWEGKQPQIFAKADASEAFTFRAIVSSAGHNE